MDDQRFDELARAMAAAGSRRVILRRLGACLTSVAAAVVLRGGVAAAAGGGSGTPKGRCREGFTNCRSTCVDIQTNAQHCGACYTVCSGATSSCCAGVCTDLTTNQNCGGCGEVCANNEVCYLDPATLLRRCCRPRGESLGRFDVASDVCCSGQESFTYEGLRICA